jgi:hypothetical protein
MTYDESFGSFEFVELPAFLKTQFLKEFNVEETPDFHHLSSWVEENIVYNRIDKLNKV